MPRIQLRDNIRHGANRRREDEQHNKEEPITSNILDAVLLKLLEFEMANGKRNICNVQYT